MNNKKMSNNNQERIIKIFNHGTVLECLKKCLAVRGQQGHDEDRRLHTEEAHGVVEC